MENKTFNTSQGYEIVVSDFLEFKFKGETTSKRKFKLYQKPFIIGEKKKNLNTYFIVIILFLFLDFIISGGWEVDRYGDKIFSIGLFVTLFLVFILPLVIYTFIQNKDVKKNNLLYNSGECELVFKPTQFESTKEWDIIRGKKDEIDSIMKEFHKIM